MSAPATRDRRSLAARRASDPQREASVGVSPRPGLCALHKGDPCFPTPEAIGDAAAAAVRQGFTHYPPVLGDPELRAALAEQLTRAGSRPFVPEEVLITPGATQALATVLLALLDEGDEAIVLDPTYSAYAPLIRQPGATVVRVPLLAGSFALDPEAIEAAVTARTKLIVLNNPANPTGVVHSRAELEALAEIVSRHDLLLLADEVYDRLLFGEAELTSALALPELAERTLYVNSFSKTYAMTGWRIGYVAGPLDLVLGPVTLQIAAVNGVNWPTQRAALAALVEEPRAVEEMRAGYAERLARMTAALERLGGATYPAPQGAFYVFARFERAAGLSSEQLTGALLEAGVAVRSGSEFGPAGEGYLRLSYSAEFADIEGGVERLAAVLAELEHGGSQR